MNAADLLTPALLIDRTVVARNARRLLERAAALGCPLRPHLKSAKSAKVANLATGGVGPVCVSTIAEADQLLRAGFSDFTLTSGLTVRRLDEVAALQASGARLNLVVSSPAVADLVGGRARALGVTFAAMVEVDTGHHRTGCTVDGPALMETARRLHGAEGVSLRGVITHAGHAYDVSDTETLLQVAREERNQLVAAADRLASACLPTPERSLGSTPTLLVLDHAEGITELRAGGHLLGEGALVDLGLLTPADLAVSVLTTVIGHAPARGCAIVDAGALALAGEVAGGLVQSRIRDASGSWNDGLTAVRVEQEHGFVHVDGGDPEEILPIGSLLQIVPWRPALAAVPFDSFHVTEGTAEIVDVWSRAHGW